VQLEIRIGKQAQLNMNRIDSTSAGNTTTVGRHRPQRNGG
jgi:hypothetical protein